MMKSAQDVASDDAAAALNRSAMWSIFLHRDGSVPRFNKKRIPSERAQIGGVAPHDYVVKTPIARSTCLFCRGDRGAIGRSRMPIDWTRRVNTTL